LTVGDFTIYPDANTCERKGETVPLTRIQFALMAAFMRHPNQTLTRERLLDIAFRDDFDGFDRAVDAHIRRLRRQIEPDPGRPRYILTVYGIGYKLVT
ncbi:MAG: winged helix-turn-helix transcriptional regulator, partial [Desulfobacterales bacterium]|nr:winged helix-turn-helix transcriptional regulator [Desulfobacterales bacterium]